MRLLDFPLGRVLTGRTQARISPSGTSPTSRRTAFDVPPARPPAFSRTTTLPLPSVTTVPAGLPAFQNLGSAGLHSARGGLFGLHQPIENGCRTKRPTLAGDGLGSIEGAFGVFLQRLSQWCRPAELDVQGTWKCSHYGFRQARQGHALRHQRDVNPPGPSASRRSEL